MKQGFNKDWTDAVREKAFSGGVAPSPASWEAVGRRVRRAAALRRSALAAVAALPVLALLLWAPWKTPSVPAAPAVPVSTVAQVTQTAPQDLATQDPAPSSVTSDPTPVIPGPAPISPDLIGDLHPTPTSKTAQNEDKPVQPPSPSANPPSFEDEEAKSAELSSKPVQNEDGGLRETPRKVERPRIAVGLRAGAGTFRRTADIAWQSAPYIAALTYLNAVDPTSPGVKSNTTNTLPLVPVANELYPDAVSHYTHDLPLTAGLSVRMELAPRIGLESGLEYTYLHSVQESVAGRLDQRLHFIGLPLRADVRVWSRSGFGFYAGLGFKMEKCVSATLGRISCEEPRLQWSAEAFGGIQYRIGSLAQLYFQPELSYYFTRTDLVTYRTEHPLGVSLHVGLRFDL